jgi:acetaldehyde dehydrogenase (acetylating)
MTTGLDPAMTLGCGGWGGNITSDNISPKHLLNIKRLAYETQPAQGTVTSQPANRAAESRPPSAGLTPDAIGARIDQFLASRGIATPPEPRSPRPSDGPPRPAEFVCEEDVRQAVLNGYKILLDSRTIVTPAARDLGEEKRVFVDAR